jgi:2-polyprenyl-3-methyl-5-hydroxy-6-metoxy-1,4-benzoquinol methylase
MEANYQKDYWLKFAKDTEKNTLAKDLNPTWDKETQTYGTHTEIIPKHLEIIKADTKMESVLDFGIGMGRNFKYLQSLFTEVQGFDTPPMISRLLEHSPIIKNVHSNFEYIASKRYDVVYETTVFQHIPPHEVLKALICLSHVSKYLVCHTRSYNDFFRNFAASTGGLNIFTLVNSTKCFEVIDCSIPISEASELMDDTHYQILFKSKNYE